MTSSVSRRVSASVLALAATAALALGGSTEAWGATSTWNLHHANTNKGTSAWEAHSGGTRTLATSAWEARTSAWE
jgi:hypothetical protein